MFSRGSARAELSRGFAGRADKLRNLLQLLVALQAEVLGRVHEEESCRTARCRGSPASPMAPRPGDGPGLGNRLPQQAKHARLELRARQWQRRCGIARPRVAAPTSDRPGPCSVALADAKLSHERGDRMSRVCPATHPTAHRKRVRLENLVNPKLAQFLGTACESADKAFGRFQLLT